MRIRNVCTIVLVLSATTALMGCDSASKPPNYPQPEISGFIEWLNGQRIITDKGIVWDSVWTIKEAEVSDFQVIKKTQNPADGVYSATVSFKVIAQGQGLQVKEAVIRYQEPNTPFHHQEDRGKLEFVDFTAVSVTKIGG